jgi:hypothetical protein
MPEIVLRGCGDSLRKVEIIAEIYNTVSLTFPHSF